MDNVYDKIEGCGRGWEALQLRVLYNRAAAWFNAYLLARADKKPEAGDEWKSAAERSWQLMERLSGREPPTEWKLTELWKAVKPWAGWLWLGVCATKPSQGENPDPKASADAKDPMTQLAERWIDEALPTARTHYYRACSKADQHDCEGALEMGAHRRILCRVARPRPPPPPQPPRTFGQVLRAGRGAGSQPIHRPPAVCRA
jgi:hypothetical protein